ncbi:MAG: thiamine-phosphate diphosphorylase [Armatimonadetes bacterium]|nr:thiamine-phosphate diphosphorylase [Armatimonadota bacterium]
MTERVLGGRPWTRKALMLVTDRKQCGERSLPDMVAEAVDGGVNMVQLREKDLPASELLALARQLRGICSHRALLVAAARQLLPASMLVGRSAHAVNTARQAELDGADFIVAGTVFASPSHSDVAPGGIELLKKFTSRLNIPVIAIGGVNAENVDECWQVGASGVAVISAVLKAENPRQAAERILPPSPEE